MYSNFRFDCNNAKEMPCCESGALKYFLHYIGGLPYPLKEIFYTNFKYVKKITTRWEMRCQNLEKKYIGGLTFTVVRCYLKDVDC
jgi:hypothetical protein